MKVSQTRQELLNNTVSFFNSGNRSYTDGNCAYYCEDGKRCAIGKELSIKTAKKLQKVNGSIDSSIRLPMIPKRLRNMGGRFLQDIQNLHDRPYHWDDSGLSEEGRILVIGLCSEHKLKVPKFD